MLGLSQRATDSISATLASVVTFVILVVAYMNINNASLARQATPLLLILSITLFVGATVLYVLANSRETCSNLGSTR